MKTPMMERLLEALNENRLVLPAFPDAALQARSVASQEDASALDVAREVAKDPALAARILKVANSSMFGFRNNTGSLQQAIGRMGLEHTKTLVTNFALMQLMSPPKAAYGQLIKAVRQHCIDVATVAYVLAKTTGGINPNKALLAGMLHDVGYLPLIQFSKHEPEAVLLDPAFMEGLKELHLQVGNLLMMYWQFPPAMMNAVTGHHELECDSQDEVSLRELVALANAWVERAPEERSELMQSSLALKIGVSDFDDEQQAELSKVREFFNTA